MLTTREQIAADFTTIQTAMIEAGFKIGQESSGMSGSRYFAAVKKSPTGKQFYSVEIRVSDHGRGFNRTMRESNTFDYVIGGNVEQFCEMFSTGFKF